VWWAAVRAINHALLSCAKLNREKEFAMSELGIGACMPPWPQPSEIKHAANNGQCRLCMMFSDIIVLLPEIRPLQRLANKKHTLLNITSFSNCKSF